MKRFAILLAGIMLAAAGLIALPATALAEGEMTAEIITEEAQAYYADGNFKFDIQVKVTNNTGAPITSFVWDCREARSDGETTLGTDGTTLTITLQADKDEVGGYAFVTFDADGEGIGGGGYDDSLSAHAQRYVNLTPLSITADDVTLSWTEAVYSGSSRVPDVTVTYYDLTLELGNDYYVELYHDGESVESAVDAGDYTMEITGKNAFKGTVEKTFTIKQPPLTVEILTQSADVTYAGGEFTFDIQVKLTNNTGAPITNFGWICREASQSDLTLGTGETTLTIPLQANKSNVGAFVGVTFQADGRDNGGNPVSALAEGRVTLSRLALTDDDVTLSWTEKVYSGDSQVPDVTVKYGSLTLTQGEDYTVKLYHDGESVESAVDAGDYTMEITGQDAFQGTVQKTFKINPRTITDSMVEVVSPVEYAGSPVTPEVTVRDGEKALTLGTDYKLDYSDNEGPGEGKVKVTGQGNYTGEVTKSFTITAPPTAILTIIYKFEGEEEPFTVYYKTLDVGTDYDVASPVVPNYTPDHLSVSGKLQENITVNVTYTGNPATITLDLGGGTLDGQTGTIEIPARYGDTIKLPTGTPTLKGYTFQYWEGSKYNPGDDYKVEGDHTLTAVYKKNSPTIPPTGDATPLALALALLVLSGAGLAFARKRG